MWNLSIQIFELYCSKSHFSATPPVHDEPSPPYVKCHLQGSNVWAFKWGSAPILSYKPAWIDLQWKMPQTGLIRQSEVESFPGNTEELKSAKRVLTSLPKGSKPAAERASGFSRDAHNRIMTMSIERGHAVDRVRPGFVKMHHDKGVWGARRR